jgi:hypothetical protein
MKSSYCERTEPAGAWSDTATTTIAAGPEATATPFRCGAGTSHRGDPSLPDWWTPAADDEVRVGTAEAVETFLAAKMPVTHAAIIANDRTPP